MCNFFRSGNKILLLIIWLTTVLIISCCSPEKLKTTESLTLSTQEATNIQEGGIDSVTATPEATATPESLIEGDIFQDPQTEADLTTVVESPSPIDNPEEFAKWQDEYLKQVDEKLVGYQGPFIKPGGIGGGVVYETKTWSIPRNIWTPISSYKYQDDDGKWLVVKTYPVEDITTGERSSFSVTYSPEDGLVENPSPNKYSTPIKEQILVLWYANDWLKQQKPDATFSIDFLPTDNGEQLPIQKFLSGEGVDPNLKTERFVFCGFE